MRIVLPRDHPCARDSAAKGTQWSGAIVCSDPSVTAPSARTAVSELNMRVRVVMMMARRDGRFLLVEPGDPLVDPAARSRRHRKILRIRHDAPQIVDDAVE